jgi:DNA invertase Pin-like site-specific DNA recombinase
VNRRTALAFGLTIVRSIEMSDVSGAAVLLAPEIDELVSLMKDPEVHGVVTREFSRLMRPENFSDFALLQVFADTNTILYLPEGPIDFASDGGRMVGTMRAVMAGIERTDIRKRFWEAREIKRRKGELAASKVVLPFGVGYDGKWFYTPFAEKIREAFKLFLAGDSNYRSVGRKVGIAPVSLREMMRNPIWTGWRVIDKKRDLSPSGKYPTKNGRQGDRKKIKRAPDEVIRIKVIDEPLVSEDEFNQAQRIMEMKRTNFWRMNSGPHRFTYNGFIVCSCQSLLYTKFRRDDYYVCKTRCGMPYQRRDILEPQLDRLLTNRLTKASFLKRNVLAPLEKKRPEADSARLQFQLKGLSRKRLRILDSYFEGVINGPERDTRLANIERESGLIKARLRQELKQTELTLDTLVDAFAPFAQFDLMERDDKRALLNTLTPSIVASEYNVHGLWIGLDAGHGAMAYDGNERIFLPLGLNLKAA